MRFKLAIPCLILMLPMAGFAQGRPPSAEPRLPTRGGPAFASSAGQGMPDAVRRVERQTGGQVLNVESMRFQGREIHRVKVLEPGGRIRIIVDDPGRQGSGQAEPAFRSTRDDDKGKPKL